ncbi:MAG TPA: diguanylate cyclase [Candidatus Hydrogenedentes bacterium]|nr:diguanylate cyclase [Candidatus Hydrogenedentota bacterium]
MEFNEALFKTLIDNLSEGVYFVDPQRSVRYWNKGAEQISGYSQEEVVGHCCADNILMHVDQTGAALCNKGCPLAATLKDGQLRHADVFLHHKEGHRVPVHVTAAPIYDSEGAISGALETFHDNTPLMAALEEVDELKRSAFICPVTNVGNRIFAENTLTHRLKERMSSDAPLAVLMMSVDRFKELNDLYGRHVGDIILKMVAKSVANGMRPFDFLGRWGGIEFIAIMPKVRAFELENMAERLRFLVEHSSRAISENRITVTVSVGGILCRSWETIASVIERSGQHMQESRQGGGNRVSVDVS